MCLFVVDGTWSRDFNGVGLGRDSRGVKIGNLKERMYSNSRWFYETSNYPSSEKFYYGGPKLPISSADSKTIFYDVLADIEEKIVNSGCKEISLVGWSRGAAIATEIAEALMNKEYVGIYTDETYSTRRGPRHRKVLTKSSTDIPRIKFLGLFDSVAMTPLGIAPSPNRDREWGEQVTSNVDYYAHVVAGDRTMFDSDPLFLKFLPRAPSVKAKKAVTIPLACATHSDVGGRYDSHYARIAFNFIRSHATMAGVK